MNSDVNTPGGSIQLWIKPHFLNSLFKWRPSSDSISRPQTFGIKIDDTDAEYYNEGLQIIQLAPGRHAVTVVGLANKTTEVDVWSGRVTEVRLRILRPYMIPLDKFSEEKPIVDGVSIPHNWFWFRGFAWFGGLLGIVHMAYFVVTLVRSILGAEVDVYWAGPPVSIFLLWISILGGRTLYRTRLSVSSYGVEFSTRKESKKIPWSAIRRVLVSASEARGTQPAVLETEDGPVEVPLARYRMDWRTARNVFPAYAPSTVCVVVGEG